ncbi:VapE domain-containing protein [Fibrella forsythiae]|uniref:Virulence protein E n=1 Tax=Fibrella forsythiae TaxID=2817061 RepID=A0ABS3JNI9_9BACT|nr:VapE domain-containing protein [Fibrella forsythiae]MBO0951581.1 virulence protein E [Fibrella forsythiae]
MRTQDHSAIPNLSFSTSATEAPTGSGQPTPDLPPSTVVAPPVTALQDEDENEPKIIRIRRYLDYRYEFRLDVVANEIEARAKSRKGQKTGPFKPLNENTIMVELYEAGFKGFDKELMALMRSSYVPTYDPIKEYFETLPAWDETKPDYIAQLASYVKARDNTWFLSQYRKWLVRAVACGIGVIPFNKQCFVLVGKQNDGKSSFTRFHLPAALEAYYTEHIDLAKGGTDSKIALCENFIINLDELAAFSKFDISKFKAILTEDKVKVRRPFARKAMPDKRRASFFGSTNQANFLTDETGNVRWLVMQIYDIQHDNGGPKGYARNIDINLVWSQAYALLKNGFFFQMSREEIDQSERHNSQHMLITAEREYISRHFKPAVPQQVDAHFLMAGELVQWLQNRYEGKTGGINSRNMGKALQSMGFALTSARRSDCTYPINAYWLQLFD